MEDFIPLSAKQLQSEEKVTFLQQEVPNIFLSSYFKRKHRHDLQREIVSIAKRVIKPSYRKRYITKEEYKIIMKKVVTKVCIPTVCLPIKTFPIFSRQPIPIEWIKHGLVRVFNPMYKSTEHNSEDDWRICK